MPCMKDYGVTWDENGPIPWEYHFHNGFLKARRKKFSRYRKVANQYGVCKFVRVGEFNG